MCLVVEFFTKAGNLFEVLPVLFFLMPFINLHTLKSLFKFIFTDVVVIGINCLERLEWAAPEWRRWRISQLLSRGQPFVTPTYLTNSSFVRVNVGIVDFIYV